MSTQVSDYVPYLYTNFEKNYDTTLSREFAKEHSIMPYAIVLCYLTAIVCGKQYMKNRPSYYLKSHLALWNGSLCMFSFAGALRTTPELLYRLNTYSFTDNICNDTTNTWGTGACGFWVQLFIFSKIPELFDTYFIIARKKPLLFLHWYHHVTVLLYCWQSYASEAPQGLVFVTVNYLVHTMMYGYYCLNTLNLKPKMLSPICITAAQILQMILGSYIQLVSSYNYYTNPTCHVKKDNIIFGGIMYLSYLGLFSQFAIKRYCKKRIKKL